MILGRGGLKIFLKGGGGIKEGGNYLKTGG